MTNKSNPAKELYLVVKYGILNFSLFIIRKYMYKKILISKIIEILVTISFALSLS
tara:strand:+ start:416 stop:580 length:165 start_codon:yes stop_codon:yes gene_type:complete